MEVRSRVCVQQRGGGRGAHQGEAQGLHTGGGAEEDKGGHMDGRESMTQNASAKTEPGLTRGARDVTYFPGVVSQASFPVI